MKQVKSLLSAIFKHAKRQGFIDGVNPMQNVSIPRARISEPTYPYSLDEINRMLSVLDERARLRSSLLLHSLDSVVARFRDHAGRTTMALSWVYSGRCGKELLTIPKPTRAVAPCRSSTTGKASRQISGELACDTASWHSDLCCDQWKADTPKQRTARLHPARVGAR